jgi:hypothetical protein
MHDDANDKQVLKREREEWKRRKKEKSNCRFLGAFSFENRHRDTVSPSLEKSLVIGDRQKEST